MIASTWNLSYDGWIIATAIACALACMLPGCFLVLRRMSLMGDALSHAVLPGIAIGFLLTHSRANFVMFLGAVLAGLLTAYFTQWLKRHGRVDSGAAMGVVFTTLFALGLLLIVRGADSVELDPSCVLYGALELTPLDVVSIGSLAIPRAFIVLTAVLVANLILVFLLLKEFRIAAFDPDLADSLGFRSNLLHYLLMTMTAITTVAAFESVGSIIVVAMIIVPAAAGKILANRLTGMLFFAALVAIASGVLGHVSAVLLPRTIGYASTGTAGMIAVVAGVLLLLAIIFTPHDGIVVRLSRRWTHAMRTTREDLLALAWRLEERGLASKSQRLSSELRQARGISQYSVNFALWSLLRRGLMTRRTDEVVLTDRGREDARSLVRSHRLWEAWLEHTLGLPADHVHDTAMRLEHITNLQMQEQLAEETGAPLQDPHGRSIPD